MTRIRIRTQITSAHVFYLCILALVVVAVSMSYENRERFESVAMSSGSGPGSAISVFASPALANLLATPVLSASGPNLQVDVLQRGKDEQVKAPEAKAPETKAKAPAPEAKAPQASCPGPDMTQYIRIKDIPCWNCNVSETIH